jgi:hypothetical protein
MVLDMATYDMRLGEGEMNPLDGTWTLATAA